MLKYLYMDPNFEPIMINNVAEKKPEGRFTGLIFSIFLALLGISFGVFEYFKSLSLSSDLSAAKTRISNLEGEIISLKEESDEDNSLTFAWFDGGTPGNNYEVSINKKTGKISYENRPGCSAVECLEGTYSPEATVLEGELPSDYLSKVVKLYPLILASVPKENFEESSETSSEEIPFFLYEYDSNSDFQIYIEGLEEFLGDEKTFSCTFESGLSKETYSFCRDIETSVDGKISNRDHGKLLIDYLYNKLVEK